jgi:hypothetical protein
VKLHQKQGQTTFSFGASARVRNQEGASLEKRGLSLIFGETHEERKFAGEQERS